MDGTRRQSGAIMDDFGAGGPWPRRARVGADVYLYRATAAASGYDGPDLARFPGTLERG